MLAIDEVLPHYDVHEVHSARLRLPPAQAIAAALAAPVAGDVLVRSLFRLRGLNAHGTLAEAFAKLGFEELVRRDDAIVFGGAGAPWRPTTSMRRFADAQPGYVRLAIDFRADGELLTTETRIAAVDEQARRAFRRYWRVVGPFSAVVRRRWLVAIVRGSA